MTSKQNQSSSREWNSSAYHRLSGPQVSWGKKVLSRLRLRGDEVVLDAGCGTGRLTAELLDALPGGRVVPLPGDLARPDLGLSPGEFRELARSIDIIYHAGAIVNFIYPYEELRAANVTGTREVIRLAGLGRGVPVHYVSSTAVLAVALSMGACANKNVGTDAMASAAVPGSQQDFVVNVGDRVFFETDSTELTPQARSTLEKQAQWLQAYNRYSFTIEGHADERGTREYNIALGARRAQTVHDYLAARGVDANRMRTISYGKERPVAVCNDISCWSQNRRAVTVLNASS